MSIKFLRFLSVLAAISLIGSISIGQQPPTTDKDKKPTEESGDVAKKLAILEQELKELKVKNESLQMDARSASRKQQEVAEELRQYQAAFKKLQQEHDTLKAKFNTLSGSGKVKPERLQKADRIYVKCREKKVDDVAALCKLLKFETIKPISGDRLLCTWPMEMKNVSPENQLQIKKELVELLERYTSAVEYVEPSEPKGANVPPGFQSDPPMKGDAKGPAYPSKEVRPRAEWAFEQIGAQRSRIVYSTNIQPISIAVIDSGFDIEHPAIRDSLSFKGSCVCKADGDAIKITDDPKSRSLLKPDPQPDRHVEAHGTHCAGIILDIVDTCAYPGAVKIVPIKVDDSVEAVANALFEVAADPEIKIINLSMAFTRGRNVSLPARMLEDAVLKVMEKKKLLVCAAGNVQMDLDDPTSFTVPACYGRRKGEIVRELVGDTDGVYATADRSRFDSNYIVVVGATRRDGSRSSRSSFGMTCVDLAAPGGEPKAHPSRKPIEKDGIPVWNFFDESEGIVSTVPRDLVPGGEAALSGTSQAVPFVTASAALLSLHRFHRDKEIAQIKKLITGNLENKSKLSYVMPGKLDLGSVNFWTVNLPEDLKQWATDMIAAEVYSTGFSSFWQGRYGDSIKLFEMSLKFAQPGGAEAAMMEKQNMLQGAVGGGLMPSLNPVPTSRAFYQYPAIPKATLHYYTAMAFANMGRFKDATAQFKSALLSDSQHWSGWEPLVERVQGPNRFVLSRVRSRFFIEGLLPEEKMWETWDSTAFPARTVDDSDIK